MPRDRNGLLDGAEREREHYTKCLMKAADGIVQGSGVFSNCRRNPGMRKLQQRGASRSEKQPCFAVDLPTDGIGAEEPARSARRALHVVEQAFQFGCGDGASRVLQHAFMLSLTTCRAPCDAVIVAAISQICDNQRWIRKALKADGNLAGTTETSKGRKKRAYR